MMKMLNRNQNFGGVVSKAVFIGIPYDNSQQMAQKNIGSKFNFYLNRQKKSQVFDTPLAPHSYHHLHTDRQPAYDSSKHIYQSTLEAQKQHFGVLKDVSDRISTTKKQITSNLHLQTSFSGKRRTERMATNPDPVVSNLEKHEKKANSWKPFPNLGPKLRQTGSTLCQSPKANVLNMQHSRISEFHKMKTLGKGRFGHVFLVKHKNTGFIGALKVIQKSDLLCGTAEQNQKALKQLIRQIKIQAFLSHPNLIKLYDFFSDQENVYLFLQLACDGHLFDLLEKKHSFTEESTSILMREVIDGVNYMHKREIIHRDIKLQNIVLCHGMAKICDFGWSVHCPKEFRSTICGTPLYLSPEILMGMQYNKKIDSWAIGALTHQLFTADNPFKIQHKDDLSKIVTEDFQMSTGSPELRSFITFILRKNPSKRPDAETIMIHPFIQKYKDLETSQQLCHSAGENGSNAK